MSAWAAFWGIDPGRDTNAAPEFLRAVKHCHAALVLVFRRSIRYFRFRVNLRRFAMTRVSREREERNWNERKAGRLQRA